jgi:hypothetical protein
MSKVIRWWDDSETEGDDATEILNKLTGGWNPESVDELKVVLAKRGEVSPPSNAETDEEFLRRLAKHGMFDYIHKED